MEKGYITTTIRNINKRRIIAAFILLFLIGMSYVVFLRYFYNFAFGPFEIERSDLTNADRPRDLFQYFITIQGDEIYNTGFEYVTIHDNGRQEVESYYYALEIGREYLLVETPDRQEAPTVTGYIKGIPSDIQEEVLDEIIRESPSLQGHFMPFLLKTNQFRTGGWVWIGISFLLGLIAIINLIRAAVHVGAPQSHPVIKNLSQFGDPKRIAQEIDAEVTGRDASKKRKHLILTENWVILRKGNSFRATRFEDIIWLYKKIVQHRTYGVPTGKTFSALVYDRHGTILNVRGQEDYINKILVSIANKAPWAIRGYSDKLFKLYRKDRHAFAREVHQRKKGNS